METHDFTSAKSVAVIHFIIIPADGPALRSPPASLQSEKIGAPFVLVSCTPFDTRPMTTDWCTGHGWEDDSSSGL